MYVFVKAYVKRKPSKNVCVGVKSLIDKLQISTKVQQKKSGCHYIWGVVGGNGIVCFLQRAITTSSYFKSFPCNNLLTPDQTRKGQRDTQPLETKELKILNKKKIIQLLGTYQTC